MTKEEAKAKLNAACALVYEVECEMDINTSHVRRLGYNARIAIQSFKDSIRLNQMDDDIGKLRD